MVAGRGDGDNGVLTKWSIGSLNRYSGAVIGALEGRELTHGVLQLTKVALAEQHASEWNHSAIACASRSAIRHARSGSSTGLRAVIDAA